MFLDSCVGRKVKVSDGTGKFLYIGTVTAYFIGLKSVKVATGGSFAIVPFALIAGV